jgi:hypothetical protein
MWPDSSRCVVRHYLVDKSSPTLFPDLRQVNPVHALPSQHFKIHYILSFPLMLQPSKHHLSFRFYRQTMYTFVFSSCVPHASSISFHLITLIIFVESSKTLIFIKQCVLQVPLISSFLVSNIFLCTIPRTSSDYSLFLIRQTHIKQHENYESVYFNFKYGKFSKFWKQLLTYNFLQVQRDIRNFIITKISPYTRLTWRWVRLFLCVVASVKSVFLQLRTACFPYLHVAGTSQKKSDDRGLMKLGKEEIVLIDRTNLFRNFIAQSHLFF